MTSEALPVNTILDNRYHIKEIKGQGGFGITYLAEFKELGKKVAIKECFLSKSCKRADDLSVITVPQEEDTFSKYRDKFLDEAKQISSFEHPNIIKISNYFKKNNTAYYVMDYIEGITLFDLVRAKGTLTESDSIHFIKQIAEALQIVHEKKTIHKDIKPSNILIQDNTDAILIDFGAARDILDSTSETIIVSDGFSPIEQYQKKGSKNYSMDIYALGATLYFCLTGQIPISAIQRLNSTLPSPKSLNPSISQSINNIIIKAMEMSPENRYSNISSLIYDLTTSTAFNPYDHITLTDSQVEAIRNINEFLIDKESRAFILSGPVHSGKSHLIHSMIENIQKDNRPYRVLTVGSRLAEVIRNKNKIDIISSIYPLIYNLEDQILTENVEESEEDDLNIEKINFGVKSNNDPQDMVYIIDEAQLLSDHSMESELFIFGSGRLLSDLLSFIDFNTNINRKIILVGDDKYLLRGSEEESALSKMHLEKVYSLKPRYFELKNLVVPESYNPILDNGIKIRQKISEHIFNELSIIPDSTFIFNVSPENFKDHYISLPDKKNTILINSTNKQVLKSNLYIRKITNKNEKISIGDKIITNSRISLDPLTSSTPIHSGEFGEIIWSNPNTETHTKFIKGKPKVNLTFREVKILFPRIAKSVTTLILEDFLFSENPKLTTEERIALLILSKENVKRNYPNKKSKQEIDVLLKSDKYFNVALIKFGYSITCHRAQGLHWSNIYINFENDQGKENRNYFSWCYSAITRATSQVYLINAPLINPYIHMLWKENEKSFDPSYTIEPYFKSFKLSELLEESSHKFKFPTDKPFLKDFWARATTKLEKENIKISKIDHNQYQEIYHFVGPLDEKVKILFSYNGKGEFTKSTLQPANDFSKKINEIILTKEKADETYEGAIPASFEYGFLQNLYIDIRKKLSKNNILIFSYQNLLYQDKYTLFKDGNIVVISIFYNKDGFFSTVMPEKANSKEFLEFIKNIFLSFTAK